jgi:hypothetical protein
MAKTTYASMKLKVNTETKEIDVNGSKIEVLQYLPIDDKYTLLNVTLQKAKEGAIYNPLKKDMFFHLHLVYMYTNLVFTDKQREDESKLYDTLVSNGVLDKIIEAIPESEFNLLYSYLNDQEQEILKFRNTVGGAISEVIQNLPIQAEQMQKIVDNFDPQKFQNVLDFAKAANGGRDIQ